MLARRRLVGTALAAPLLPFVTGAAARPSAADAADRPSLRNVEAAWTRLRFEVDQAFEQVLVPRESWLPAKPLTVRGTFDLGDRESGTAEKIVGGVRTGLVMRRPSGSSR